MSTAPLPPEIENLVREIDSLLIELKETIHATNNFNHDDRRQKLMKSQRLIQGINTAKEAIVLEARGLTPAEKQVVEQKLRHRMETFRDLADKFEFKRTEIDRDQLQAEADSFEEYGQDGGAQALIAKGDEIQDMTQGAITNMAGMVGDAEDIGAATAAKMDAQIEQMQRIERNLDDVQYNTKRARDTAAKMARGAASDLCIQILCGSIVVCTITVIVLVSV